MFAKAAAFTLLELLVALLLVASIALIAVPSFASIAANNRLHSETNALFHAIYLARKESIARRRVVTLCASTDGQQCAGSMDWSDGWILFVNKGRSGADIRDSDEELLRYRRGDRRSQISANRQAFSLRSTYLRATNGTFVICDRQDRAPARALIVSYTGRPRIARSDRRGRPYTCPH